MSRSFTFKEPRAAQPRRNPPPAPSTGPINAIGIPHDEFGYTEGAYWEEEHAKTFTGDTLPPFHRSSLIAARQKEIQDAAGEKVCGDSSKAFGRSGINSCWQLLEAHPIGQMGKCKPFD
jgi:hypothetical protein